MSIESPSTYGEWYWKAGYDANVAFADMQEIGLAPYLSDLVAELPSLEGFPPSILTFIRSIGTPGHSASAGPAGAVVGQMGGETLGAGLAPAMRDIGYAVNKMRPNTKIPLSTAIALALHKQIDTETFNDRAAIGGFTPEEAMLQYAACLTYPALPDILRWARYSTDDTETWSTVQQFADTPDAFIPIWEWLSQQVLSVGDIQKLYVREFMDEESARTELIRQGWRPGDIAAQMDLAYSIPNAMLLIQYGLMQEKPVEEIRLDVQCAGIHPDYAQAYLESILTKPAPEDILRAMLRTDWELRDADRQLTRIGIHPDFIDVYKTLMHQIPPVGDIITMAVREAFTPAIAERFGQYEDFPTDLQTYAAMQGLSPEWAKRYWAAHWSLPSPQQGFEMLHRGVIEVDDLDLLLRASDVMPFWRDKLVQIAYRPLTRVDVRRMYGLGVLDEGEVYEAYRQLGYDKTNAERMAEFTVKQVLETQSRFNATDIIAAFNNRLVDDSEARSLLRAIGIPSENASQIVDRAEYTRLWDWTAERVKGIKNLYKKVVIDADHARGQLGALNLPASEIDNLMDQWYFEIKEVEPLTWTKAETLSMLQKKIITKTRATIELYRMGYDDEHVYAYLEKAVWTAPKD